MKTSARLFGLTLCMVCFMALQAWAGELLDTELNEFTSNTQALAVEVNENFDAVQTEINDNDSRITTMESGKQNRVNGLCASGSSIRAIAADGTVTCEPDTVGSGDITSVTAGTGLTGGGSSGGVTLNADTTYLQRRVGACSPGYSIQAIAEDGTVTCEYDSYNIGDITAVYAGTGLTGGSTSGSATLYADTAYLQRRVASYCGTGYAIKQITDTEMNSVDVPGRREQVLGIGPGAVYHHSKDLHFFLNVYFESDAENRPEGKRANLRMVYHF